MSESSEATMTAAAAPSAMPSFKGECDIRHEADWKYIIVSGSVGGETTRGTAREFKLLSFPNHRYHSDMFRRFQSECTDAAAADADGLGADDGDGDACCGLAKKGKKENDLTVDERRRGVGGGVAAGGSAFGALRVHGGGILTVDAAAQSVKTYGQSGGYGRPEPAIVEELLRAHPPFAGWDFNVTVTSYIRD
jgi:hypothetical protein